MSKLMKSQKKIENTVVAGYQKIEDTVVSGYKKNEEGVVGGYKKIENKFFDAFLSGDTDSEQDDTKGEKS